VSVLDVRGTGDAILDLDIDRLHDAAGRILHRSLTVPAPPRPWPAAGRATNNPKHITKSLSSRPSGANARRKSDRNKLEKQTIEANVWSFHSAQRGVVANEWSDGPKLAHAALTAASSSTGKIDKTIHRCQSPFNRLKSPSSGFGSFAKASGVPSTRQQL
jgi:hypothetical protein